MSGPTVLSLAVALLLLSGGFWLLERLRPADRRTRRSRADTRLDLAYWFFTPLVTRVVTRLALGVLFVGIAWQQGVTLDEFRRLAMTRQTWASGLPLWAQVPLILLIADLLAYGSHRLFHARVLWPFHAIHHSSTTVDWLSSVRLHPVNDVVSRVLQVLPLYWMGFNGAALAAFVPFLTFYALVLHANVNWTFGPLRFVVASPVFHRWHHTTETEGLDRNFAGLFPFIDLAFGTFYMPRGREPRVFGVTGDPVPAGLWRQLVHPFRALLPVLLAALVSPAVWAQSSVAPASRTEAAPQVTDAQSLMAGLWDYNRNLSVNAATNKPEQAPVSATERGSGGGGRGGAGWGGGATTDFERRALAMLAAERRTLVRDLLEVPETLTIGITATGVTFTDDLGRARTYRTNGRPQRYQLGAAQFQARASWDGARLHKDIDAAGGFRMTETFFLTEDRMRLIVIVRVGDPRKPDQQFGVNRVYDRVTSPRGSPAPR